jgi:MFS family permease
MISGPIIIAMQVGVYPFLVEKYGVLRIFSVGCDLFALACFFIPAVSLIPGQEESKLRWIFVVLGLSVIGTSAMWVFTSIFVLINNSCYSHERATVNGIGQTCASLGRFTGPYLGALTFAWSENNRLQWPFDYFFTWYLIGMISIGNSYLTKLLPRSIERRKREPREPRYAVTMMGTAGDETPGNDYDESNTVPLLGSPTSSGRGGRKRRPRRRFRFPDDSDDEVKDPTGKVASGPEKGSNDNNSVSADSPLLASSEEKTTSNASPNSRNSGLQDVESKAFDRLPV